MHIYTQYVSVTILKLSLSAGTDLFSEYSVIFYYYF